MHLILKGKTRPGTTEIVFPFFAYEFLKDLE
jgi:hypothetical protein